MVRLRALTALLSAERATILDFLSVCWVPTMSVVQLDVSFSMFSLFLDLWCKCMCFF